MAIFTAGCIEQTDDIKKIRNNIYKLAKNDLDSPAMKISVRKSPTCINFIAFLPKEKIVEENILKKVSECEGNSVIVFELDYKNVGIVCKEKQIIDYILDKPEDFAKERGLKVVHVDNTKGVKLVSFNLDNHSRETKVGFISLGFTILFTATIFFSGYQYMKDIRINEKSKNKLVEQYKKLAKKEFDTSSQKIKKVDIVEALSDIEKLTKATHATLRQVKYEKNNFCIEVQTLQKQPFLAMLPSNTIIKREESEKDIVKYCYEKI